MPKKILVVDDDRCMQHLLGSVLRRSGYDVVTALDGTQGIMQAHRERPDLILLDIVMPAGSGVSVCEKLQKSAHTKRIPIVVVTSSQEPEVEEKARAAHAHSLILKPFDVDRLLAHVSDALAAAPARR